MKHKTNYLAKKKIFNFILEKKLTYQKKKIIQISYDIRSGQSIKKFSKRKIFFKNYIKEVTDLISKYFPKTKSILDCGSGELLTTSLVLKNLKNVNQMYCFDYSFKRLLDGKNFSKNILKNNKKKLNIFCADMFNIPLPDNSVDLVTTFQSLEPNGSYEYDLISELLRVSRTGLFLMEPDYENAKEAQKKRMKKFKYIKNLPNVFMKLKKKF